MTRACGVSRMPVAARSDVPPVGRDERFGGVGGPANLVGGQVADACRRCGAHADPGCGVGGDEPHPDRMVENHGQDEEPLGDGACGERPLQGAGRVPVEQVAHPRRNHAPVNRAQGCARPFRADGGPVGAFVAGGGALLDIDERADPLTVRVGDGAFAATRVDVPAGAQIVLHACPERLRVGAAAERLAAAPVGRVPVDDPPGALPVAGGAMFGRDRLLRLLGVGARGAAHGRGGRYPVAVPVDRVPEPRVVNP